MTEPKSRSWLSTLGPTIAVGVVFSLGIWAGRFLASLPFRQAIGHWDRAANLGLLADSNGDRPLRAAAFEDEAAALRDMNDYTWVPTNTPTPFVGSAPAPGQYGATVIGPELVRGAKRPVLPKPKDKKRVFLTGGSTAFSSGAPREDATIGAFLEKELNAAGGTQFEVFTLANPAWCSTHERIAIENQIGELEPDLVIALNGANDLHWGVMGWDTFSFRAYWEDTFFKITKQAFELSGRTPPADPTSKSDTPVPCARIADRYFKNLRLSAHALALNGTPYLVALQPTLLTGDKTLSEREQGIKSKVPEDRRHYFEECTGALVARVTGAPIAGLDFVDLRAAFKDDKRELYVDSYHFGDRGNALLAHALAEAVKQREPGLFAAGAP